MKTKIIIKNNHPHLLLFFAGWGADETPFKMYHPANSDYIVCYDYRNLSFDAELLKGYEQINVVGWSMGVWAASQVLGKILSETSDTNHPFTLGERVAINGTPFPIDEKLGITPAIYHGTLDGLTGASLHKFLRRMCAGSVEFREFLNVTPRRPIEELRDELIAIEYVYSSSEAYPFEWNKSVVGTMDRIIPVENQRRAWTLGEKSEPYLSVTHSLIELEAAHYDKNIFKTYLEKEWTNS